MAVVSFVKYHGLGNDFLVCLEPAGLPGVAGGDGLDELDAGFAMAVCDRHRGVGADGVIVARPPAGGSLAEARMELRNADGSRAELSGNGLRCLALAMIDEGVVPGPSVVVETDAGMRKVVLGARRTKACAELRGEMGTVDVGPEVAPPIPGDWRVRHVDAGNPHLVLLGADLGDVEIGELGPRLEATRPGGQNVEVVVRNDRGDLEMLVWERGAGVTEACGTGSSAAAAAVRAFGVVGERVVVHNPGGDLVVDLEGDLLHPSVWLTGPACRVGRIDIDPCDFAPANISA